MHKLSKQAKYYKLNELFMALYSINKLISITDFGQNSKLLLFFKKDQEGNLKIYSLPNFIPLYIRCIPLLKYVHCTPYNIIYECSIKIINKH